MKYKRPTLKYTAVDKKTYDTDTSGLEFNVEINGIKARGFWTAISQYNPGGVDIDELILSDGRRVSIFSNGGGRRFYEVHGTPKKLERQPKNLRFTGQYYSTINLGSIFKDKIRSACKGELNADLSDRFIEAFKLELK